MAENMVTPVLLAGGTGTRLWPLSRESYPKQYLAIRGERTLLQQTALRTGEASRFAPPIIVANNDHRFIVAEQMRSIGFSEVTVIVEPAGRNTAPAAAVAAIHAAEHDRDALLLIASADHVIEDEPAFLAAVESAAETARNGRVVLFGITPTGPATGYGYIRVGNALGKDALEIAAFVEKPDAATAESYLQSGDYLWNAGIFLVKAATLIEEFERHAPDVLIAARAALISGERDLDFLRLGAASFKRSPSISLDHAIMEKTVKAAVLPLQCGWSDLGAWSTLWELEKKDEAGNVCAGAAVSEDTKGCYLRGERVLVAAIGVENLVVIATDDVVLVAPRDRDQDVKRLVDRLKREGRTAAVTARQVHRPWGFYESVHEGHRFQVKRITVNPGAKLSLQKHFHRAEHWVVVNGTAIVTRDDEEVMVRENESVYLPLGCMHRLFNPGKVPLNLIEVQSGAYLGEDDIVRVEDIYERV